MTTSSTHTNWTNRPLFFLLLPVFFVLHGLQENRGFVPLQDALLLLLVYLIAAIVIYFICVLLFRNRRKAALASFLVMAFHFFFGGLHDGLKDLFAGSFITRYSVLLPLFVAVFIAIFILIKKSKSPLLRASAYLNLLLIVLILFDAVRLVLPAQEASLRNGIAALPSCDTCVKPDIYLVILDEYAGQRSLTDLFSFDNSAFEQQLRGRGFYVARNSSSNYNYTPFSMASLLNMQYLQLQNTERQKPDLTYAFSLINNNQVVKMLQRSGYDFYNHSVFNLPGRPAPIEESFIPAKTRLITSQTFLSRLEKDLGYHLATTFKVKAVLDHAAYRQLRNNTKLYELTRKLSAQKHQRPRFVYTHLMMPHYPYYFDRNGNAMDTKRVLPEANNVNRKDYVEYLQYTNNKILELADHIKQAAGRPPIIILMSDHGFRHFNEPVDRKYHFMNLNAIYLPNGNYNGFYDSMSNVNQFRLIFNAQFNAGLPLLKDTSIYLKD